MTVGFARDDSTIQAQCPCCGRFPSEDGFYAWVENDPDFISLFCNEACAHRFEARGGQLIDGDGQPYRIANLASYPPHNAGLAPRSARR